MLQTFWDEDEQSVHKIVTDFKRQWPECPITYFDWFAHTETRNAYLFEICDAYVKKNMLDDLSLYEKGFSDTNLTEHDVQRGEHMRGKKHSGLACKVQRHPSGLFVRPSRALIQL